jgi:glycosyltransferase
MKITIITCTYNSEKTIRDCIESVHKQSYPDIEHIIMDGASEDNTIDVVKSIPGRVSRIVSEPDDGLYHAMNKAINLANGEIIGILNSDDFYASPVIIERIINTFESTGCDSLYGNLDFLAADDPLKVIRHWKSSPFTKGSFKKGWHPPHPTFFVRHEVYKKFGLFDTALSISADFELMLRFLEKHAISTHYIDETIVKMRYGGASTSSIRGIILGNKNVLRAFRKNEINVGPFYTIRRFIFKISQFVRK